MNEQNNGQALFEVIRLKRVMETLQACAGCGGLSRMCNDDPEEIECTIIDNLELMIEAAERIANLLDMPPSKLQNTSKQAALM